MKYGTWNFPAKAGHFDHRIGLYFLTKWNKICQQVTSVYKLLLDGQKFSLCPKVCWRQQKSVKYAPMRLVIKATLTFDIFSPNES